jgi:CRP/FNR family cyclic AMP-dependent transcriptional regulator
MAMRRISFQAGQRIFGRGDPSDLAYMIVRGKIDISLDSGPAPRRLASLGPGEVFGEMGLIDSGPRSATATAVEDCVCMAIDGVELLGMLETEPKGAVAYVRTLIRRLRAANEQIGREPE